ncbi:hypothetical protein PYCC9005_001768 [Savitreella phatthalungensis]
MSLPGSAASAPSRFHRLTRFALSSLKPGTVWREVGDDCRLGKLRETAWLDGLRGYASFLVYITHHLLWAHRGGLELAYGYDGKYQFITLPFVRTFFTGSHAAVSVFFIISGYVLTYKPTLLAREGRLLEANDALASSVFRRAIRLYIPVLGVSWTCICLYYMTGVFPHSPADFSRSIFSELYRSWYEFWVWSYPMRTKSTGYWTDYGFILPNYYRYNLHTWTIPVEVQGSMVVFLLALATSRMIPKYRIGLLAVLSYYFLVRGGWFYSSFVAGMALAEVDQIAKKEPFWPKHRQRPRNLLTWASLVLGLYLAGMPGLGFDTMTPAELAEQPGWSLVAKIVPDIYSDISVFVLSIAAVFLVIGISHIPRMKAVFEMRVMQYLGRNSFAFYLVHGPVLSIIGDRVYHIVGREHGMPGDMEEWTNLLPLPDWGPSGLEIDFILPHIVLLPVTLYLSDVCTKLWDEPSVRIAQWSYNKVRGR